MIGFCRRFATYKRAHLLFTDLERLERIVNDPEHPVLFFFSGKAHPADGAGQGLIKRIFEISRMPQFLGKIIFLEDYDMQLARRLVSGVDIWMNTPTRPLEASGTSGEKAEMNGVVNLSVLDDGGLKVIVKEPGGLCHKNEPTRIKPIRTSSTQQPSTHYSKTKSCPFISTRPRSATTRPTGWAWLRTQSPASHLTTQ